MHNGQSLALCQDQNLDFRPFDTLEAGCGKRLRGKEPQGVCPLPGLLSLRLAAALMGDIPILIRTVRRCSINAQKRGQKSVDRVNPSVMRIRFSTKNKKVVIFRLDRGIQKRNWIPHIRYRVRDDGCRKIVMETLPLWLFADRYDRVFLKQM
jgi:hypothetical protein